MVGSVAEDRNGVEEVAENSHMTHKLQAKREAESI